MKNPFWKGIGCRRNTENLSEIKSTTTNLFPEETVMMPSGKIVQSFYIFFYCYFIFNHF